MDFNTLSQSITPETFQNLLPVHRLIFEILEDISPVSLVAVKREFYHQYIPKVYQRIILTEHNIESFIERTLGVQVSDRKPNARGDQVDDDTFSHLVPLLSPINDSTYRSLQSRLMTSLKHVHHVHFCDTAVSYLIEDISEKSTWTFNRMNCSEHIFHILSKHCKNLKSIELDWPSRWDNSKIRDRTKYPPLPYDGYPFHTTWPKTLCYYIPLIRNMFEVDDYPEALEVTADVESEYLTTIRLEHQFLWRDRNFPSFKINLVEITETRIEPIVKCLITHAHRINHPTPHSSVSRLSYVLPDDLGIREAFQRRLNQEENISLKQNWNKIKDMIEYRV